ncbi:hypothetical protein ACFVW9_38620 [Streptomyces sp. NPDC058217]|uniref:hypothetical protein n=1 Tax=Streptomyces sp. NPDC058217 TaxID=3346384 RepID=UPI0036E6FB1A
MDFLILLLFCLPSIALGVALVRDYRGLRTFFASRPYDRPEEEKRYRGPTILTGWVFIAVGSLPIADQLRLFLF